MSEFNRFCHRLALDYELLSPRHDFDAPLFAAFHRKILITKKGSFDFTAWAVDCHRLGIAAATVRILGFAWADFKNRLAQIIFARDLFSRD